MIPLGRSNNRRRGWLAGIVCLSTGCPLGAADFPSEAAPPRAASIPLAVIESPTEPAGPDRRLSIGLFEDRGFSTFGWIEAGIGANNWGSPFNGPIVMADRSWQGQVNQLVVATERVADTGGEGWAWGGRADLLIGTDSIFTTARGLDAFLYQRSAIENVASWAFTKDYGLA